MSENVGCNDDCPCCLAAFDERERQQPTQPQEDIVALKFPSPVRRRPPPCGCDWRGCYDCHPESDIDPASQPQEGTDG